MAALPIKEGFFPFRGYQSFYKIVGDVTQTPAGMCPLLALHGRPPSHEALEPLASLAASGRPVIFYDQLGCGRSDRPDDPAMWNIDLFVDELAAIRQHLQLAQVHLLGHSWGGVIGLEYALRQPGGLVSLILHSTYTNRASFDVDWQRLHAALPADVQDTIRQHEAAGTTIDPAYQQAIRRFAVRHVCRIDPWAAYLERATQRPPVGSVNMQGWNVQARLGEIAVPTLITCGRYDFCTPAQAELIQQGIPNSELIIFEASSHYAHIEETDSYLTLLHNFMTGIEKQS